MSISPVQNSLQPQGVAATVIDPNSELGKQIGLPKDGGRDPESLKALGEKLKEFQDLLGDETSIVDLLKQAEEKNEGLLDQLLNNSQKEEEDDEDDDLASLLFSNGSQLDISV